ncbi:CENP-B N-terminal DNA-binding domain [Popillia japonica]|uniref:CENP-B N-terminal DNA-binding domain n=1 Tax=Popillia japonica TaxID=7064 RepID=A0AAW1N1J1_POPJA
MLWSTVSKARSVYIITKTIGRSYPVIIAGREKIPRQYKRKTQKPSSYTRENLHAALGAIRNGTISIKRASLLYKIPRSTLCDHNRGRRGISIKRASLLYKIPRSTLCDHNRGRRGVKSKSSGRTTDIPLEQEMLIAESIKTMEKWGFGLSRREVFDMVGELVKANGLKTRFNNGISGFCTPV